MFVFVRFYFGGTRLGRAEVKIKKLLRFYYSADSLNKALDNLIMRLALAAGEDVFSGCGRYAERIASVIDVKQKLGGLWARLDEIISAMTEGDRLTLKKYASMRVGPGCADKKEIHRASVKFARRAGGLLSGSDKVYKVLCAYQCLLSPAPS